MVSIKKKKRWLGGGPFNREDKKAKFGANPSELKTRNQVFFREQDNVQEVKSIEDQFALKELKHK